MTDLCVGIIVQPLQITHLMSVVNEKWDICGCTNLSTLFIGRILCAVSLLTASVISVDRLFALLLGLRYRQFVTLKRACETVINCVLVFAHCLLVSFLFKSSCSNTVSIHSYSSVSSHHDVLLHENIFHSQARCNGLSFSECTRLCWAFIRCNLV